MIKEKKMGSKTEKKIKEVPKKKKKWSWNKNSRMISAEYAIIILKGFKNKTFGQQSQEFAYHSKVTGRVPVPHMGGTQYWRKNLVLMDAKI